MSTDFNSDVTTLKTNEAKLLDSRAKVARFCYEEQALEGNTDTDVFGVASYNYNNTQNVPLANPSILQMSETVLSKGLRSQGSSFTRMGVNHFFGRVSYNVNKLAKHLGDFLSSFKDFLREGDNAWSPTATYGAGDVVYVMLTKGGKTYKRTFSCLQECTNLAPVDSSGNLTNTTYWEETGGNVMGDLHVAGESDFTNNVLMEKNLTVRGDLVVDGSTIVTDEETVSTKSNYMVLRQSNPSGLGSGEKSGMVVHNYNGNKNAFMGVDQDGIFRVSDNASENTTTYTNKSKYGAVFYDGLTQTTATVVSGATVAEDMDELEDCVLESGTYYHSFNGQWFSVSLVSNKLYFDKTSPVTDPTLIATLEAGTKDTLFYYRSISILVVSDASNQPLLTRQESSDLTNDDILRWDSTNQRAKGGLTVSDITSSATSYKIVNGKTITGTATLVAGSMLPLYFTADINGSNVETTLTLTYNGTPYAVKVNRFGSLVNFSAHYIDNVYRFIQASTALNLMFDGTYLVVLGNPIVLSSYNYKVYADGSVGDEPIATVRSLLTPVVPYGWLLCDDTWRSNSQENNKYWNLWNALPSSMKSGDNFIVDLRELVLVGAGQQNYFTIATHDVYNVGDFRDDQTQRHTHYMHHEHNRGNMDITGTLQGVITNLTPSGTGALSCTPWSATDRSHLDTGNGWWISGAAYNLKASDGWTGQVSGPVDMNGNPISFTGTNTGRTHEVWDVTHGKQIGVQYIIKWAI